MTVPVWRADAACRGVAVGLGVGGRLGVPEVEREGLGLRGHRVSDSLRRGSVLVVLLLRLRGTWPWTVPRWDEPRLPGE